MEEKKMQYLFGMHPVLEAVRAGKKFDKVLLKQGLEGAQFRELLELLKQNEIIDALVQRVEKLEQNTPSKKNPFEVDVVATKESLRKLKETILGIFR